MWVPGITLSARGGRGKESAKGVMHACLRKPDVRRRDDQRAARLQSAVKTPQQEQRTADMLNAFAAANQIVIPAIVRQAFIQIVFPESAISGRFVDVEVDAIHDCVVAERLGEPAVARGGVEGRLEVTVFEKLDQGLFRRRLHAGVNLAIGRRVGKPDSRRFDSNAGAQSKKQNAG